MKILVAFTLLVAPWFIFAAIAMQTGHPSTIGLVITLAVSAYGLNHLIAKKK